MESCNDEEYQAAMMKKLFELHNNKDFEGIRSLIDGSDKVSKTGSKNTSSKNASSQSIDRMSEGNASGSYQAFDYLFRITTFLS
jgi:hypothetical protein